MTNYEDVFISYAREDTVEAQRLSADLTAAGLRPWLDEQSLLPGQRWKTAIKRAIVESRYFIALLSSRSVSRRGYVHKELTEALEILDTYPDTHIYLIPARLDPCQPSHERLDDLNWVDMFPDWRLGVSKIVTAIRSDTSVVEQVSQAVASLRIDDVIVTPKTNHVALDVRLRNAGTVTINLTRADLHVLSRVPYAAAYQSSASYELLLADTHNVIAIAHALQPNEVDRFIIRVGFTPFNTSCGFTAQLEIQYNKDQLAVSAPFDFSSTFRT